MIKQAYFRGLTKKAVNTDFLTRYDDRWSRAGLAGLAVLLGSKALGAGWGTAGALAALAGTGAYNTHNYDAIKNRVAGWLDYGKNRATEWLDLGKNRVAEWLDLDEQQQTPTQESTTEG